MTDHNDVPIVATGDWIDAAWINQYIGDNVRAWRQAYTAAGMMAYAVDNNTLAGLAIGSNGALMKSLGSAPEWLALGSAYKLLRANAAGNAPEYGQAPFVVATKSHASGYTYATNAWRDAPFSSGTITLLVQSTILVFGVIVAYGGSTYGFRKWKWNINGADVDDMISHLSYDIGTWKSTPIIGYKTGVAAGARTVKLREICESGDFTVDRLQWIAIAIPEQ